MTGHTHPPKNVTLRGYRAAWMLTQQEAADRVGVTRQTIAAWESGERRPTAEQLVRLARAYRLAVEDLLPAVGGGGPAGADRPPEIGMHGSGQ